MARELGDAVHLNDPVEGIQHDESHVTVLARSCAFECDAVVIAVPLAVLSRLTFTPGLPDWKLNAIARSGVGHVAKLHAPLSGAGRPPWSAVQSVPDRFWTWTATDFSGGVQPLVHCFSGSQPALERLAVESGPKPWAARVQELREDLVIDVERAVVTTWSDDQWTREGYTAMTTTVEPNDDEVLARAIGGIHFAGEHTAGHWAGLMEGALRSGRRAADEIVATTQT
jgi:monoamine oxidase